MNLGFSLVVLLFRKSNLHTVIFICKKQAFVFLVFLVEDAISALLWSWDSIASLTWFLLFPLCSLLFSFWGQMLLILFNARISVDNLMYPRYDQATLTYLYVLDPRNTIPRWHILP